MVETLPDSFYLAMGGDEEMKQAYEADKKKWLVIDKFSERTHGLFKPEFISTRDLWLTAKCYFVQNEANENKYSCKGVSNEHNDLHFQRYKNDLDVFLRARRDSELEGKDIDKAKNVGFRIHDQGIVIYEQNKLGLSAYYNKRYVLTDGIHERPSDF